MNNEDIKNLELLSIFHYVVGGVTALFSCIPLMHVAMGLAMIYGKFPQSNSGPQMPAFLGWIFVIMGSIIILLGWSMAICILIAGKKLKHRKHRIYCMVVAGIECMFMPLGTILGIFTLIALNKDSIKALFGPQTPPPLTN